MSNPLIDSLTQVVLEHPDDPALRLHLAELLIEDGRGNEAVAHCAAVLQNNPGDSRTQALMARALGVQTPEVDPSSFPGKAARPAFDDLVAGTGHQDFDWKRADAEVGGPAPAFIPPSQPIPQGVDYTGDDQLPRPDAWEVEAASVTLDDVGGMADVKQRLDMAFLAPMRNPEMRRIYGKSLRGGLLLYGPPGCGKTYIARAIAGEMGAKFINITLSDILDKWLGESEHNIHEAFELARRERPVVLFLDEIDAIGGKRTSSVTNSMRGVTNQLLQELDGVASDNEGVFVLAATNTPWDVDPALRRPGRLDRSVCVLPPDDPARVAILHRHLRDRPCEGINLEYLAAKTRGFTGADLAHLCDSAVEFAMMDSLAAGSVRMVQMRDFNAALAQVKPSVGPWFDIARNVVTYADRNGQYAELAAYMKANRLL